MSLTIKRKAFVVASYACCNYLPLNQVILSHSTCTNSTTTKYHVVVAVAAYLFFCHQTESYQSHLKTPTLALEYGAVAAVKSKRKLLEMQKTFVITFVHQVALARRQRSDLSVFESSCRLPTCLPHTMEASHCPFNC